MPAIQIIGAPVQAQRPWLFSHIADSRKADRPVVLYVPEQYTLQAERDLMTGLRLPGLLEIDVISPTRLKSLVQERAGSSGRTPLDEAGRAMAIHQALHACAGELTFYQHLGSLYGGVARVDQTLSEMQEEGLTPEDLEKIAENAKGARQAKYQDLSRIWRASDTLLQDRFDDPVMAWRDLCDRLAPSGLWRGADLYVYGFDTIRPDLRELLAAATGVCASLSVLLTMTEASAPSGRVFRVQRDSAARLISDLERLGHPCRLEYLSPGENSASPLTFLSHHLFSEHTARYAGDPSPYLTLYAASTPTAEALSIVSALRAWHGEGIPWNRMAIALPRTYAGTDTLLAALERHEIPFFHHRKETFARHGISRLLSAAMTCVSQGYAAEPLLEILSCGFGTLSREEGAVLTEYARTWGIDRSRWRKPFTRGENAPEAEALRQRLLMPIEHLHDALRAAKNAGASVEALFRFLQEEEVYPALQNRQQRLMEDGRYADAVVDRQVWELLMSLLDELYALLGDRRVSLKEMALLLSGALERASLSALPEEEEGVLVGQIGHMLPGRTEALILPGMNEGVLHARSDSLLSDAEKKALESGAGKTIGLSQSQMGMVVRADYIRTVSLPEKRLRVSFCLRDESGTALLPGEPVFELRRLFPALQEQGGIQAEQALLSPETPSLALEGLGPMLRTLREDPGASLSPDWQAALRGLTRHPRTAGTAGEMLSRFLDGRPARRISGASAVRLFQGDRVSISRLECFAGCPFQHFLRYGLKPSLPQTFEFTPGDAGNFFHLALQRYVNRAVREPDWPRLSDVRTRAMMDAILDQITAEWLEGPLDQDALGKWQGEEYLRRVRHAASMLTRFAANSDFSVVGTEMEFGSPGGMPPLILRLTDGAEIALQGKIDRLDLYRGPEGDYLRILDLKSSEKNLEPALMDSGEQLQLMIYLQAALRGRPGSLPAGALYYPVQDREVKAASPEEAEDMRRKKVQLQGVVLSEESVIRAMDRDQSPYSLPKVFNQDGSVSKSAGWALPEEVLRHLMEAAARKAAELCERMRAGEIPASPSVLDDRTPCTFCEFKTICPRRKGDERPLEKGLTFRDVGSADKNGDLPTP